MLVSEKVTGLAIGKNAVDDIYSWYLSLDDVDYLEVEEQGEDLAECVDHQPSSFERGKPRSILSLLLYKSNLLYMNFIYCYIKL
jgi:hypothetical protein